MRLWLGKWNQVEWWLFPHLHPRAAHPGKKPPRVESWRRCQRSLCDLGRENAVFPCIILRCAGSLTYWKSVWFCESCFVQPVKGLVELPATRCLDNCLLSSVYLGQWAMTLLGVCVCHEPLKNKHFVWCQLESLPVYRGWCHGFCLSRHVDNISTTAMWLQSVVKKIPPWLCPLACSSLKSISKFSARISGFLAGLALMPENSDLLSFRSSLPVMWKGWGTPPPSIWCLRRNCGLQSCSATV